MRELLFALTVTLVTLVPPHKGFQHSAIEVSQDGVTIARIWPRAGPLALDDAVEERARFSRIRRGEVLATIEFLREWRDYRGQMVPAGVYALSYMVQPRLKDHAGTSEWRDFAILECDKRPGHPFVMALLAPDRADATLRAGGLIIGLELDATGNLGF